MSGGRRGGRKRIVEKGREQTPAILCLTMISGQITQITPDEETDWIGKTVEQRTKHAWQKALYRAKTQRGMVRGNQQADRNT